VLLLLLLLSLLGAGDKLDLVSGSVWALCDLLLLLLLGCLGALLRLRPWRYFSAGFRKIPDEASSRSALVPSREEVVPVTGSHRRFSIKIGLERYLNHHALAYDLLMALQEVFFMTYTLRFLGSKPSSRTRTSAATRDIFLTFLLIFNCQDAASSGRKSHCILSVGR
jgi:hypothetical protein